MVNFPISSSLKLAPGMSSGVRSTWLSAMLVISNLLWGVLSLTSMQLPFFFWNRSVTEIKPSFVHLYSCIPSSEKWLFPCTSMHSHSYVDYLFITLYLNCWFFFCVCILKTIFACKSFNYLFIYFFIEKKSCW